MSAAPIPQRPQPPQPRYPVLGLSQLAIIGLALLAVSRAILHDLHLISEGSLANLLLVIAPAAIWIAVALLARVPKPLLTLLVVGAWYGVLLAIGHQLLWDVAFDGAPPQLGGALADLDSGLESAIVRTFAAASSLVTGLLVGAVSGLIAWGIRAIARRA
ncbi:hypothetical protein [Agrococcus sp. ARC_14]|uniref:hypothetical protein n=1 Tax=Agrococcus sp. ARC_14 TaxID=2919927 RepID=UPI001F061F27|nr:hypothetical protein [Agrococcus sp. ARC_14]MCH1883515.1 hypothetical protein [Agrococcus sp. ARC_14]